MLHEQKETYNSQRFLSQAETGGAVYKLQIKAVFVKNHLHSIDPIILHSSKGREFNPTYWNQIQSNIKYKVIHEVFIVKFTRNYRHNLFADSINLR